MSDDGAPYRDPEQHPRCHFCERIAPPALERAGVAICRDCIDGLQPSGAKKMTPSFRSMTPLEDWNKRLTDRLDSLIEAVDAAIKRNGHDDDPTCSTCDYCDRSCAPPALTWWCKHPRYGRWGKDLRRAPVGIAPPWICPLAKHDDDEWSDW